MCCHDVKRLFVSLFSFKCVLKDEIYPWMYVWGEITEVAKQMHRIYKIPQSSRMWSSCWQCTLQCAYSIFIVIICILEVLLGLPFLAHGILLTHYMSASKKFIEWNRSVFPSWSVIYSSFLLLMWQLGLPLDHTLKFCQNTFEE